jgi:SAM-dependent methyltransferase
VLESPDEYRKMAEVEKKLWWYRILHERTLRQLQRNFSTRGISILDAGCGTGGLLSVLKKNGYSNVQGVDISEHALKYASELGLNVRQGRIEEIGEKFKGQQFDAIISNDVLCYFEVSQLGTILKSWSSVLKPGGIVLLNMPSHKAFRGMHDISVGINYRISIQEFREAVSQTAYKIEYHSYWPFLLSPLIYLERLRQRIKLKGKKSVIQSDVAIPGKALNIMFYLLTRFEYLIPGIKWGSSLQVVLIKGS